jgi:hypothetical protein
MGHSDVLGVTDDAPHAIGKDTLVSALLVVVQLEVGEDLQRESSGEQPDRDGRQDATGVIGALEHRGELERRGEREGDESLDDRLGEERLPYG